MSRLEQVFLRYTSRLIGRVAQTVYYKILNGSATTDTVELRKLILVFSTLPATESMVTNIHGSVCIIAVSIYKRGKVVTIMRPLSSVTYLCEGYVTALLDLK